MGFVVVVEVGCCCCCCCCCCIVIVEVGCPPELAPEGGHPIPLICRGRKRFVRGNLKQKRKEAKNEKIEKEQVHI